MAKRILIVDDDPDFVLFLSTVLRDHGYEPLEAADGRIGLEKAFGERPDLILLDLMMPHKSGISLLNDLSSDPALKSIPVIMVTGVSEETGVDLDSFLSRGAAEGTVLRPEGYLDKPVDPDELLRVIRKIVG